MLPDAHSRPRSISIVIPAYNEERRLPSTLEQILEYLGKGGWSSPEVLVVDDGSTDSTIAVAEQFQRKGAPIRVLRNPGNRGKGYSVRHGMLEAKGDWVLFTDADLSSPIQELDKLFASAEKHRAAVAIGSRAVDRSLIGAHQPLFRENVGRLFNLVMRFSTGLPFKDTQCGFKLFEGVAAHEIFKRQQLQQFGFDVEVLLIAERLGYRTVEVPVRWNDAEGSKVGMLQGANAFVDLARIRWHQTRGAYGK